MHLTGAQLPGERPGRPPETVRLWKLLVLYCGVPTLTVVYGTLNNWKLLDDAGLWTTLAFYAAHGVFTWPVTAVLTWVVWRGLRSLQPNLIVITTLGSLLSCLVSLLYIDLIMDSLPASMEMSSHVGRDWGRVVASAARATAIWIGINWIFDRYLGLPRYRYTSTPAVFAATGGTETPGQAVGDTAKARELKPAFMQRLTRAATLDALLAIRAEQHYIQVITESGQELVLYRMSDAVRELPPNCGVRVHRSWWVHASAIRDVTSLNKKMSLTLRNGLVVPVSAPYQALTRSVVARRGLLEAEAR